MPHRQIFIVLFFALFVAMLGAGIIAPTIPLYAETLGATGILFGLIYSAFSVSRAVFMPLTGKLSDRRGRKAFITTGLTIYTLASLGYIWADTPIELVWIRFLHGIGSAMVIPIAAAAIGDLSPKGREGSVMGTFNVALFLGFGTGPLLGGLVLDAAGASTVFLLMGSLSALALLTVIFFIPEKQDQIRSQPQVSRFQTIWTQDVFKGLLIFRFSNAAMRGTTTAFLPVFAIKLGVSPGRIGLLVSLNILLTAVLQLVFGKTADRRDRRLLIIAGNLLTAIPLILTPLVDCFTSLLILGTIMGVGGGLAFPAASAVATELGRRHGMGNIMGFFNQSMSFGMIVGPVISGFVMDLLGISVVFLTSSFLGCAGSAAALILFYRNRGV